MDASRWKQIEQLVGDSLRKPAGRRAAFLDRSAEELGVSGEDVLEVCAALLAVEMEQTPDWGAAASAAAAPEAPLAGIEAFELIEELGAGGMGVVYRARQSGAVEREVALKICPAQPSLHLRQRLQQERRTLALLNHPNIAQMLEAGDSPAGQPYFVMELVAGGKPVNDYCDAHRLPVVARLTLFLQICAGVQYAHQHGVLHRDLKPGNVLAGGPAQAPQVKIIDFGIAKLLQEEGGGVDAPDAGGKQDALDLTGLAILGTPNYMSPERLQLSATVDTRSDIYSLGVMLYELLLGQLPCRRLPGETVAVYRERRAGVNLPTLAQAWSQLPVDQQLQLAQARAQSRQGLARILRGDLRWIVARALADDPAARYASASELAADLQRHLQQRPVLAAPATARYQLGRLIRRRRWWVLAGTSALSALLVAFWLRGVETDRANAAASKAQQSQAETERALRFLGDLFVAADPRENLGRPLDAAELLRRGVAKLDEGELEDAPLVRARLLHTIAEVEWRRGEPQIGLTLAQKALLLREQAAPEDLALRSDSLHLVGTLHSEIGGHELAEPMLREALELRLQVHGPGSRPVLSTLNNLGVIQEESTRYAAAVATYQRMLDQLAPMGEASELDYARTLGNQGVALRQLGRFDAAEAVHRQSLAIHQRRHDPVHPNIALDWHNLGDVALARHRYDAALAAYREAEQRYRQVHGNEHGDLARTLNGIGNVYKGTGEWQLATEHFEQALAIYDREGTWAAGYPLANLALVALEQHDWPLLARRTGAFLQRYPEQFPDPGQWMEVRCLDARARLDAEAASRIAEALQRLGTEHVYPRERARCLLAGVAVADQAGDPVLAETYARQATEVPHDQADLRWVNFELRLRQARLAEAAGDRDRSAALTQALLQEWPADLPPDHGIVRGARSLLAQGEASDAPTNLP